MYHKGKPQAHEICARPLEERFEGTVKSFSRENRYGFIEGTHVITQFGQEVYFKSNEKTLAIGTAVSFKLCLAFQSTNDLADGTPEAVDVKIESRPASPSNERFSGRIKLLSAEQRFGFIECFETMQKFGRDIYLPHTSVTVESLEVGAHVSFQVNLKYHAPQAVDVQLLQPTMEGSKL